MRINSINQQSQKPNFKGGVVRVGDEWVDLFTGKSGEDICTKIRNGCNAKPFFVSADSVVIAGQVKKSATNVPMVLTEEHATGYSVANKTGFLSNFFQSNLISSAIKFNGRLQVKEVANHPQKFILYPVASGSQPNPNVGRIDYSGHNYCNL
jgi:hypothetical protein